MPSSYDLLFNTDRFNLSKPKDFFINECCYGDDVAQWLRAKLKEFTIESSEPGQEDWGWYIHVQHDGNVYFVGIGGIPEKNSSNFGAWRLMIEKRRFALGETVGTKQAHGSGRNDQGA